MTVTSFTVGVVGTYYDYFSSVGTLKQYYVVPKIGNISCIWTFLNFRNSEKNYL